MQQHLIHPTTLDGVLQLATVALTRGGQELLSAYIPISIEELYISADAESSYEAMLVSAKASACGPQQSLSTMRGIDSRTRKPLVILDGFLLVSVTGKKEELQDKSHYYMCYNADWKPDISFLDQSVVSNSLFELSEERRENNPTEIISSLETLAYLCLRRYFTRRYIPGRVPVSKPWMQKYVDWALYEMDRYTRGEIARATKEWETIVDDDVAFVALEAKVETMCAEGPLAIAIGRSLGDVLEGKVDALETLFTPKFTEHIYRYSTGIEVSYAYITKYVDLLAHKNSNLVFLEIGAGTGGATLPVLEILSRHGEGELGTPRFERYDFTDISPSFLEAAEQKFHGMAASDRMKFRILNIEKDLLD